MHENDFQRLASLVQGRLGIMMPPTKKTMLMGRLRRRLSATGFNDYRSYCDHVFSPEGADERPFLRKLMAQHPIPVVMCSSLTGAGSETALKALEYGAVEVIEKPRLDTRRFLDEARIRICDVVKAAAHARPRRAAPRRSAPKLTADAMLAPPSRALVRTTEPVVAIGASTGGTEALRVVLTELPADAPGVVVVQHMPAGFTAAFARRLDGLCGIEVKEAANGDELRPGRALIAPGNALRELAARDPAAFERRRRELVESYIASVKPDSHRRLRGLQWRLDQVRRERPALGACVSFSRMMWESLYGDGGLAQALTLAAHHPAAAAVLESRRLAADGNGPGRSREAAREGRPAPGESETPSPAAARPSTPLEFPARARLTAPARTDGEADDGPRVGDARPRPPL
ncbi:DUF3135 domain-containing protein [Endothiovibrio diazotrophicus]